MRVPDSLHNELTATVHAALNELHWSLPLERYSQLLDIIVAAELLRSRLPAPEVKGKLKVKVTVNNKFLSESCGLTYGSIHEAIGTKVQKKGTDVYIANEKTKETCLGGTVRLKWYEYEPAS